MQLHVDFISPSTYLSCLVGSDIPNKLNTTCWLVGGYNHGFPFIANSRHVQRRGGYNGTFRVFLGIPTFLSGSLEVNIHNKLNFHSAWSACAHVVKACTCDVSHVCNFSLISILWQQFDGGVLNRQTMELPESLGYHSSNQRFLSGSSGSNKLGTVTSQLI